MTEVPERHWTESVLTCIVTGNPDVVVLRLTSDKDVRDYWMTVEGLAVMVETLQRDLVLLTAEAPTGGWS